MQRINDFYYAWGAAAADINHDGMLDVVAGPFYYLGPDYTDRHEFTASRTTTPSNQFSQGMVNFAYDYTGDGWPDILWWINGRSTSMSIRTASRAAGTAITWCPKPPPRSSC